MDCFWIGLHLFVTMNSYKHAGLWGSAILIAQVKTIISDPPQTENKKFHKFE